MLHKVRVLYFYLLLIYNITYGYIYWFKVDITYYHLNEINTKTNDLNIKIRNKN